MYHFVNFSAYNDTPNCTFAGNTEISIISEILKAVKSLTQRFTKWYIY